MNKKLDITEWLNKENNSATPTVEDQLFTWLYEDLHRAARNYIRKEDPGHTLSATALTHEAWFRMNEQTRTKWASRSHFMAVSSIAMRRILLHHAIAKRTQKRSAVLVSMTFAKDEALVQSSSNLIAVHEAITAFEIVDPRAAKIVVMRFFGGMENIEIAEALGISVATVKREWNFARAWLFRELQDVEKFA